jgi:hypothetical protein
MKARDSIANVYQQVEEAGEKWEDLAYVGQP